MIAGPNGAGKTTFVQNYLNRYVDCDEFLNADLIAKGLSPIVPERHVDRAAEIFLEQLTRLETGFTSFALETTLAARSYLRRIERWRQLGFVVSLFFIWLPSDEMAIQRVVTRVAQGGHNVPVADIRRRYSRGLLNLTSCYLPRVDNAWVLNGSVTPPQLIWRRVGQDELTFDEHLWSVVNMKGKGKS